VLRGPLADLAPPAAAVAFGFGLIHGFGFASVLADLGLPAATLAWSLAGFNIGVELGQLAIVAAFLPLAYMLRHTGLYRQVIFTGGSWAAMVLAALMLASLGLVLSVHVRQLENFAGTMNFVIFPMFFISSALYPLWKLEESGAWWIHQLAQINPFTHAVEAMRFASVGQFSALSSAVVLGCMVVFFALALWGYDPQRGWMKQKGAA
jgi:ABC-type polysaccharide/polyol phosphate export permease